MKKPNTIFNQAEISRQLGISPSYVSLILRGKRKSKKYEKQIIELVREASKNLCFSGGQSPEGNKQWQTINS